MTARLRLLSTLAIVLLGLLTREGQGQYKSFTERATATTEPAPAQAGDSSDRVEAKLLLSATAVTPGQDVAAAVVLTMAPDWHIRPRAEDQPETEDPEYATQVIAGPAPAGVVIHLNRAQWPKPHVALIAGVEETPAYDGTIAIFVPLTVDANAAPGPRTLEFSVKVQSCNDKTCLKQATIAVSARLDIVPSGTTTSSDPDPIFAKEFNNKVFDDIHSGKAAPQIVKFNAFGWSFEVDSGGAGFIALLLIAAIGGFLLNLTPCVLPVIPLKILSLSSAAGTRRRTLWLGVVMSLGVIAFWMALGVAVSSVKGFTSANQLFQYPWFVIAVGAFIAFMAVGLLGFFNVGLPQWVYMINPKKESTGGAFGFGVMTAVLSTPCTAPFMGAAIAWAATQSAFTVLAVFAAVGIGMALPYLVLAAFPQLTARIPKTGPASELIKQVMALLLLAAAAFFVGAGLSGLLVNPPDPPSKLYWWAVALFTVIAAVWLVVRTMQITRRPGMRATFGLVGVLMGAIGVLIGFSQTTKGPINWTYYTPERLAAAIGQGDVVVIDFTAEWCLTCKTLESTVLNLPSISKELNSKGVAPIKVDITGNNEAGNELLKKYGRITIPLLVVLDEKGNEVFLSDTYGPQQVLDALQKARGSSATPAAGALGGS